MVWSQEDSSGNGALGRICGASKVPGAISPETSFSSSDKGVRKSGFFICEEYESRSEAVVALDNRSAISNYFCQLLYGSIAEVSLAYFFQAF